MEVEFRTLMKIAIRSVALTASPNHTITTLPESTGAAAGDAVSATDRMAIYMSVLQNSTCVNEEARDTAQAAMNQLLSELYQRNP
jgi:hypothetical protein